MGKAVSDKKNVTLDSQGLILTEIMDKHNISSTQLGKVLAEIDAASDQETYRRMVLRWRSGKHQLKTASRDKLDLAFKALQIPYTFLEYFERTIKPLPLLVNFPTDYTDWIGYAGHDLYYLDHFVEGDTYWDSEADGPVFVPPDCGRLYEEAIKVARSVWTFYKRTGQHWEPRSFLDQLYRYYRQVYFRELRYREAFRMENIGWEHYEEADELASWCALREFIDLAADPDAQPPILKEMSHDDALLAAERAGPIHAILNSFGGPWSCSWVNPKSFPSTDDWAWMNTAEDDLAREPPA